MFDTTILKLPLEKCLITDYAKFRTTKEEMFNYKATPFSWKNNPTADDKRKGVYKPRLTITKRGREFELKIEFSAPKLLFDNNLDELTETDFNAVAVILQERLKEMGVRIFKRIIENAAVSAFHPSKNILLSQGYTATLAIKELSKINLNGKFDLEKTSFRNNGQALQLYANSNSFVIYDKINDLNNPQKRAIDKDRTKQQLTLFDFIKKENKPVEVLRFEVRLSNKTKMKTILKEVGYPINPIFKDIFKKDLCQKIVNLYWNRFFENNLFIFDVSSNPQKMLQKIFMAYPRIQKKQAIYLTGLNLLCKDDEGVRGLKSIISGYKPKDIWVRTNEDLKKFKKAEFSQNPHGFIADIKRQLIEFESYKYKPP